jgi:hypothetical protein
VQRFFDTGGTLDGLYNRCFGWIEKIENDRLRSVVGFVVFLGVAIPVGGTAMWLRGVKLESQWEMILTALFWGYGFIIIAIAALFTVDYAWRGLRPASAWLGRNLPRGLVFRYRSWQLRRIGKRRLRRASAAL